jgi:hypothetical protein
MSHIKSARRGRGGLPRADRNPREAGRVADREPRVPRSSAGVRESGSYRVPGTRTSSQTSSRGLDRLTWERMMRRLRVTTGLLGAILLALLARMIILGATLLAGLTSAFIAVLVIAALLLTRQGKRLEPRSAPRARR